MSEKTETVRERDRRCRWCGDVQTDYKKPNGWYCYACKLRVGRARLLKLGQKREVLP